MDTVTFQKHVATTFGQDVSPCLTPTGQLDHGILGVASEAGELLQVLRKGWETSTRPLPTEAVIEELGDVLRYCAVTLNSLGLTFEEVFSSNAHKIDLRRQAKSNIRNHMRYLVENPPENFDD